MRQIKFRVWSKDRKIFVMDGMSIDHIQKDAVESLELPLIISTEKCVWQQYTGLKDIDRKDIYEGDIVSIGLNGPLETSKQTIGTIIWDDEEACFGIQTKVAGEDVVWDFMYTELKVIGNIFEDYNEP